MEKKILVSENKFDISRNINIVNNKIIPALNDLKKRFESYYLGQFTEELRVDIFEGNYKKIENILQKKESEVDLLLKTHARETTYKIIYDLKNAVFSIDNLCNNIGCRNLLEFVTFDDEAGNFIVTGDNLEELKDLSRTYVSTDEGIKLFNAHLKAIEALNEFFALSKRDTSEITQLFSSDDNDKIIPAELDYDFLMEMSKK